MGCVAGEVSAVELAEVKRTPAGDRRVEVVCAAADDLFGRLPLLAAVGTREVEVLPGGAHLRPELRATDKLLAIKELVFDQPMDRLDIALPGLPRSERGEPWAGCNGGRCPAPAPPPVDPAVLGPAGTRCRC